MSSLTPAQEALRALAVKATKGEWACEFVGGNWFVDADPGEICRVSTSGDDAAYIAAANPATILALIEALAAAREVLAFYRDNWVADMIGDGGTPGLSYCFMQPTDELLDDGGERARAHLATPADATTGES